VPARDRSLPARPFPSILGGFFTLPGSRPWLLLSCLLLASFAEGFGFATLLPVLALLADENGSASPLGAAVLGAIQGLGVRPDLGLLLAITAAVLTAKALAMVAIYRFVAATAARITARLRERLLAALLAARWLYFVRAPTGRFTNAMGIEAHRCGDGYLLSANFVVNAIQSGIYLFVALLVSWRLALLAFAAAGTVTLLLSVLVRRTRKSSIRRVRHTREMTVLLTDTLANLKPIKAMGKERAFFSFIRQRIEGVRRAVRQQMMSREALAYLQEALLVLILTLGFYLAHRWFEVTVAELVVSGLLLTRTANALGKVQKSYQRALEFEPSLLQVRQAIAEAEASAEPGGGRPPPPLEREIRFEGVRFAYEGRTVFDRLDLVLPAHKVILVVGPSGSGKTTLVDLLLAFLEPQAGRILIDGVPLDALDRLAWRRRVGYAPQELVLLHASVRDNLTLGDPGIGEEELRRALALAEAEEIVNALPEGLETSVGERGLALSGGQRQRLALARALAVRPRLLILDEVTSALDLETERRLCRKLAALAAETTILAITHRPAWFEVADLVLDLERRRLAPPTAFAAPAGE